MDERDFAGHWQAAPPWFDSVPAWADPCSSAPQTYEAIADGKSVANICFNPHQHFFRATIPGWVWDTPMVGTAAFKMGVRDTPSKAFASVALAKAAVAHALAHRTGFRFASGEDAWQYLHKGLAAHADSRERQMLLACFAAIRSALVEQVGTQLGPVRHFLYKLRRYREGGGTFPVEGVDMVERLIDALAAAGPFAAGTGRGMDAAQTGPAAPPRPDRETQLAPIGKGFIC